MKRNCKECNTKFNVPKDQRNKIFCGFICSKKHVDRIASKKAKIKRELKELEYNKNPKLCKHCLKKLSFYDAKSKKFCNRSCSASYNNKRMSKETRQKQVKSLKETNSKKVAQIKIRWIRVCAVCGIITIHRQKAKKIQSCGDPECYSKLMSSLMRGRTGGSTKQFITYTNKNLTCSLDSSWELLMAQDLDKHNILWSRPSSFLLSNKRRYTPDFYLPDYDVYLDPKAYRRGYLKQIEKIKLFEKEYSTRCFVISDKNNLTWSYIKTILLN